MVIVLVNVSGLVVCRVDKIMSVEVLVQLVVVVVEIKTVMGKVVVEVITVLDVHRLFVIIEVIVRVLVAETE